MCIARRPFLRDLRSQTLLHMGERQLLSWRQAGTGATLSGVPAGVWASSVAVGVTVTIILFCSHFHQIEGDRAAGKRSPLVRLGSERALKVRAHKTCYMHLEPSGL